MKTAKEKWLKPSPDPTREGYIFDGWSDGTNGQKFGGAVTASTTFTAKWKELYKRITIQGTGDQAMLVLTDDPHDAGLYFKWGSVVGLYNAGGANSRLPGAVTDNFSLDDIAFNPTNSKYITITDWNSVPYSTGTALQHNYGTVTMDGLGDRASWSALRFTTSSTAPALRSITRSGGCRPRRIISLSSRRNAIGERKTA